MKFASDILLTGAPIDMFGIPGEDASELTLSYTRRQEGEILYLDITMSQKEALTPPPFSVYFEIPAVDLYTTWVPTVGAENLRPNWMGNTTRASLASWLPVQALLSAGGENRMTVALSNTCIPTGIVTGIREERATAVTKITFFTKPTSARKEYAVTVRLDFRPVRFYQAITEVSDWWETDCGYTPAYVPEGAREPIDSLWYSFHQDLDPEEMLKECRASRPFGLKTCIIDDGWQTDDSSRGYSYCGDWELATGKIPDMKAFCDELHKMDMKLVLWYSVPFVGLHSKAYERFKDMFLDFSHNTLQDVFVLDPRYKEVRDYLIGVYTKAQREWGLDGFKLDFIDSFYLQGRALEPDPRRDFTSLEEAVDALMTGVMEALTAVNPDVLIEFRQSYIGPAIRKFGNMLRVGDCPNDPISNRVAVLNMRLTSGHTAVHSDMLMWNAEDTVESAARALTSVLFSVPQISVRLDRYPEEHKKMLKTYLDFWYAHKTTLLDGKLEMLHPECRYTQARAKGDGEEVLVSYSDGLLLVEAPKSFIVNATSSDRLILRGAEGKSYRTSDCMGNVKAEGRIETDLSEIAVPVCGFLTVE